MKERLDKLLVDRGLCDSRTQAQALIMAGKVTVNGQIVSKAGTLFPPTVQSIEVSDKQPYVSRGGLKLKKALAVFKVVTQDRIAIDVGASTGGFTDCLLQQGAAYVIALDVGHGQLDWKLRNDDRVQVLEKTHIAHLDAAQLLHTPSLGVVDTSFISLKKVLPPLEKLLQSDLRKEVHQPAEMIALLKPQFEIKDYCPKAPFKGVVHGEDIHTQIIEGLLGDLITLLPGWHLVGLDFSPLLGPKGNREFLLHWIKGSNNKPTWQAESKGNALEGLLEVEGLTDEVKPNLNPLLKQAIQDVVHCSYGNAEWLS